MDEREKQYVPVVVLFDQDGKLWPMEIRLEDGQSFKIDRVLDVCRAACESVGGVGQRYTVRIKGQETYIWLEGSKWFIARKVV